MFGNFRNEESGRILKFFFFSFLISIFLLTVCVPISYAATYGPYNPGTVIDTSPGTPPGSTETWTNEDNAKTSDNSYAIVSFSADLSAGVYLKATNFGFNIPFGSTIQGITVSIERKADFNNYVLDKYVQIIKSDGSIGTTNNANVLTKWDNNDETISYGDASNLWGETWTISDINDSDFGVALSVQEVGSSLNIEAMVDSFSITITYSLPSTPTPMPTNTPTPIPTKTSVSTNTQTYIQTETSVPTDTQEAIPNILDGISTASIEKLPLFDVVTTPVQSDQPNIIPFIVVFSIIGLILILFMIITWKLKPIKLE